MRALFSSLGALGCLALAACSGAEAADRVHASSVTAEVAQAAPSPEQAPSEPAPSEPVAPPAFQYDGALTQGGHIRGTVPRGTVSATLGELPVEFAEDGLFFAAFDRDSEAEITLSATLEDGRVITETLTISAREWDIQHVNVARRRLRNPEAYWREREPEYNAIVEARAQETGAEGWRQDFIWPLTGRISGSFGNQRIYRGEPGGFHGGVDIARASGTPFVAPADGVVVLARTGFSLEGGLIIIDHGLGLNSAYLHASRVVVSEGQAVTQGQHIGNVGSTGRSTGPHLDWRVVWRGERFDPVLLAGPMN